MRPEYIEGVDAVRFGWSLWMSLLVPAGVIWLSALLWLWRTPGDREWIWLAAVVFNLAFFLALALFWFLAVAHSNEIQATKGRLMVTDAEQEDWASDTWNTFAPFMAVPYSLVYCTANALLAHGVCFTAGWFLRRRASDGRASLPEVS